MNYFNKISSTLIENDLLKRKACNNWSLRQPNSWNLKRLVLVLTHLKRLREAILCCKISFFSRDKGYLLAKGGYSGCKDQKKKKGGHKRSRKRWHRSCPKRAIVPFTISGSADAYNSYLPDIPRCRSIQISKK